MQRIELYGFSLSAPCAKVETVLRLKGLEYQMLPPAGGIYTSDEYRQQIAAATIPAIRHGDFLLHDSDTICEYLEEICPSPPMHSADIRQRALHRSIGRFLDSRIDPAIRVLFALYSAPDEIDPAHLSACADTLQLRLSQLERLVEPSPFLGGERLVLADCGALPTIRMGQAVFSALGSQISLPRKIESWCTALTGHSTVGEVAQTSAAALDTWITSKLG